MFSLATAITNAHCGISVGLARRCDIVLAKSHFAGKMLQRFRNILERKTKTIKEEFSPPPNATRDVSLLPGVEDKGQETIFRQL